MAFGNTHGADNGARTATALIAACVVLQAFVPVFAAMGGGESPFIFNAAWRIGAAVGCALFLAAACRALAFDGDVWSLVWRRARSRAMLLWVLACLNMALYAWAARFIDISVVAMLYGTAPVAAALLAGFAFGGETRRRKTSAMTVLLFVIALLGAGAAVASQVGGIAGFTPVEARLGTVALGAALAAGAALSAALGAFGFRWSAELADELPEAAAAAAGRSQSSLALFGAVAGLTVCNLAALPLTAVAGLAMDEAVSPPALAYGAAGGLLIGALAAGFRRAANPNAGGGWAVSAIAGFAPALALIPLAALALIGDVNRGYLFFGAASIVIANLGIYYERRESEARREQERGVDIIALIESAESERVEFKSTLRTNTRANRRDRRMEQAALKEIAAFLNTDGGTLIIGVADDGSPVGIGADGFASEDRMSLHLTDLVSARMGQTAMRYVRLVYADYEGVRVLAAVCAPASIPIYSKEGNDERFYTRSGPSSRALRVSEIYGYIDAHFPRRRD